MFLKISEFHWSGLVGPALAIAGAALLIAAGSIFFYMRSVREREGAGAAEIDRLKRMGVFGILMIGAGLAAFAVLSGGELLTERYEFAAPGEGDVGRIFYQPLVENRKVQPKEMIRRTSYKVVKDELQMNRSGYVETPFVVFGEGTFVLEFQASGGEVEKESPRMIVGILELGKDGTALVGKPSIYDLTTEAKTYRIPLRSAPGKSGAVRIEFLNATTKIKGTFRSITISNVVFKRE